MAELKNFFLSLGSVLFPLGFLKKRFDSWDRGNSGAELENELVERLNAVRPSELQNKFADY